MHCIRKVEPRIPKINILVSYQTRHRNNQYGTIAKNEIAELLRVLNLLYILLRAAVGA